jgi:hypothetical protein
MRTLRVYTDTSVLGGCFDPEFAPWSNGLVGDFRHIVRLEKIRLFNAVSEEIGYRPITICSPREVTTYGQFDDDSGN